MLMLVKIEKEETFSVAVVTALAVAVLLACCDLIVLILKLTVMKLRESRGLIQHIIGGCL